MDLAAVVLAAGLGTRLRPLTGLRPKALCPVGNVPLVDGNIARARRWTHDIAVNTHHRSEQLIAHLREQDVTLSVEEAAPLGTAGAIGNLKDWIAGRDVLVLNADAWHADPLEHLFATWDHERPSLLVIDDPTRPDFEGRWRYAGACVLPARVAAGLPATVSGLSQHVFEREPLQLVPSSVPFFDCGTIADYHAANMAASGGNNVVGQGARVLGRIERCVLWEGVTVAEDEHLVDAIRATDEMTLTV